MNSKNSKAWQLIQWLNNERTNKTPANVIANAFATQLVLNGKPLTRLKKEKLYRRNKDEINHFRTPFTKDEVRNVIKLLKNREAVKIDDIQSEQI